MKTGIALLPEMERSKAITFSLVDYLLSTKYLTKKQISEIINELETVVLTASLLHDEVWEGIHKNTNISISQKHKSQKGHLKKTVESDQLKVAVHSICDSNCSNYINGKIETSVNDIIGVLKKQYRNIKVRPTAIRDHYRNWKASKKDN